jgi:triphosphatase
MPYTMRMVTAPPSSSTGELALHVMRQQATLFAEHVPQARPGGDPEHVHQARVATRRLRAAVRLFGDLLPPELGGLHDELSWLASQLGAVRDLDVQLKRLDSIAETLRLTKALAPYRALLEDQRAAAHTGFDVAYRSARFVALIEWLRQLNEMGALGDVPIEEDAPRRLRKAYRQLNKRASRLTADSPGTEFHKVRIRAKRLRYACEFFEPTYHKRADRMIDATTDVQDLLGDHQDGLVATERIRSALADDGTAWSVETAVALGQIIQWEAQHTAKIRREFRRTYRDTRRSWRRLRHTFSS